MLVLVLVLVRVIGVVIGTAPDTSNKTRVLKSSSVVAAVPASGAVGRDSSVVVQNSEVKFYFASGEADWAMDAAKGWVDSVKADAEGKKLDVSSFHVATGNVEFNIFLAKRRARAVAGALKAVGVAEGRVELKKP